MAEEEDYSSLPLEQRLTHKVWKVRSQAYTDLANVVKTLDPDQEAAKFNNYEHYLPKMVLDTNMAAQEAGVAAAIVFVQMAPSPIRCREEVVGGIVAKCLAATKAGTRTQSVELLMQISEADNSGPVVAGILEGFEAKQPKAVAAAVAAVRELIHAFGVKFINLKTLLKAMAKPFAHKDNGVRMEAQKLAVELYRWLGQAIMPSLNDLPPVLLKDLETQFAAVANEPPPKQTRLLRSQQDLGGNEDSVGAGSDNSANGEGEEDGTEAIDTAGGATDVDPWELADPVDIATKLPSDYHDFISSKKWKERKEVVDKLHETLEKTVRLELSHGTGDVIQDLGKRISDVNINVATVAIQCLGLLASGIRHPFAPHVQSTLPALIERLKERKQVVIEAIHQTTDSYFMTTGYDLSSIGDHYFTGATHKNPQVRAESNRFLKRCLAVVTTRPGKGDVKRYADQLKTGLDDGDAGVRESAAECLGTLSKLVTARVLEPFIESIDKIKMEKVNEYAETATIKFKATTATAKQPASSTTGAGARGRRPQPPTSQQARGRPRPAAAAPAPIAASNSSDGQESQAGGLNASLPPHIRKKLEASSRAAALKKAQREGKTLDDEPPAATRAPAVHKPQSTKPAISKGRSAAVASSASVAATGKIRDETIRMKYANDESLDEKIASVLPENILDGLSSSAWKERVEAMDLLKDFLGDQAASGAGVHSELVIRQFERKPGWKESNFQVNSRVFQSIEWMAKEESEVEFNTGAAALCIPALVDKLGDIKLKTPAGNALVAIAERFSLKFVVGLAEKPITGQKSPKVLGDCIAWLDTQLVEFGTKGLALRSLVNIVKEVGLKSNNAQTRTKAVSFMGTLRRAVGSAIMDLVGDINPQLLQLLEAEFDKVGSQPMPEPIRGQGSMAAPAGESAGTGAGGAGTGGDSGDDPMDDLFPRQDLNATVGPKIYKQLGDANWKERKAALDVIQNALESAKHRILPNISGDLYTALGRRLKDANKNLIVVALNVIGSLSKDSGAAQVANVRLVAMPTILCLGDKKPQVRVASMAAMMAWAKASPASVDQAVLPVVPNALGENSSPELRTGLLKWVADVVGPRQTKGERLPDLSHLISPLFVCLQDRNVEVRKQAQRVLRLTVASCGFETVFNACEMQLHGAEKNTVAPMIEEFRHVIGTAGDGAAVRRSAAVATLSSSRGVDNRDASPTPEPVMTASELLGKASTPMQSSGQANGNNASGPGRLRRPMAVRRPAAGGVGSTAMGGIRGARPVRGSGEGSRPGSSLRAGTPTATGNMAGQQLSRMSNEELELIPPILNGDQKAKEYRARRDMAANSHGTPRWAQLNDVRVRSELEAQLKEQTASHFNPLVHRLLFSNGHYKDQDYLSGLDKLVEAICNEQQSQQKFNLPLQTTNPDDDTLAARYDANVDLLLKYISLRMYDGSTHTLLKCFDLLEQLIKLVEWSSGSWSDYEVQAILPALISRLGDAKETVRSRARAVLAQRMTHLYPTTKLFTMLLEYGVINKMNARIRHESLDCIGFLIKERTAGLGLSAVCAQPNRAIPIIAQGIADRDSNVRTSTLNVLVSVGEQLAGGAAELKKLCGRMAEKEKTMLDEKLKRSSIGSGVAGSNEVPPAMRPSSRVGGGVIRSGVRGGNTTGYGIGGRPTAGANSNRLAASHPQPPQPISSIAASTVPFLGEAASTAVPFNPGKPMFSLDFDKLALPAYSTATSERLSLGGGAGRAPSPAQQQQQQQPHFQNETANSAIGYGAGRSSSMHSTLSGLKANMSGYGSSNGGSPIIPGGTGSSRPGSLVQIGSPSPSDFSSMNEMERDQWMEGAIADLDGEDMKAAVSAMERLRSMLLAMKGSMGETQVSILMLFRRKIDTVVTAISMLLRWAYTTTSTDPTMRSPFHDLIVKVRKNTLGLLIDIFNESKLCLFLKQDALQTLFEELIRRLVDPLLKPDNRLAAEQQGLHDAEQLAKGLNTIMIKILDKADRTMVYVSLVQLLENSMAEAVPIPPPENSDLQRMEFGDMVMRCLWRITKQLKPELESQFSRVVNSGAHYVPEPVGYPEQGDLQRHPSLRIDPILRASHRFFQRVPESEWRNRSDRSKWMFGDLPKRTVKTINHTVALVLQDLVWQFTGLVIRDVAADNPQLLSPPPPTHVNPVEMAPGSDPDLDVWAQDTHTKMLRASGTWGQLNGSLKALGEEGSPGQPTAAQLLMAINVVQQQADMEEDEDEDGDEVDEGDGVGDMDVSMESADGGIREVQQPMNDSNTADRLSALRARIHGYNRATNNQPTPPPRPPPPSNTDGRPGKSIDQIRARLEGLRGLYERNK